MEEVNSQRLYKGLHFWSFAELSFLSFFLKEVQTGTDTLVVVVISRFIGSTGWFVIRITHKQADTHETWMEDGVWAQARTHRL